MLHPEATGQAIFSYDPPGGKMEENLPPLPGSTESLRARSLPRDRCRGEGRLRAQGENKDKGPCHPPKGRILWTDLCQWKKPKNGFASSSEPYVHVYLVIKQQEFPFPKQRPLC